MSQNILFNGVTYTIPDVGDESWGEALTEFFVAIPQGALQKTGGVFTLSADVNFGASFGLLSRYFSTRALLPSTAGLVRLNVSDSIGWRNTANDGNLLLAVNGSDQLLFNGAAIYPGGITALTGDVLATGPGSAPATIANNAITTVKILDNNVTLAKLLQIATASFLGRTTASTGNVEVLTGTQATALLNNMVGDSGSGGTKGLVPAPAAGDAAAAKFLKADGTWQAPAGSGTVTSVAMTVPTALFAASPVAGSPVTTSGTLAPTLATQTAGTFFCGPLSGSAATPTFKPLQVPTIQKFTSGSGTYTTPSGVLYLKVTMVGGGGGGAGSGTSDGSAAGTGGVSFFRVGASPDLLVANGGGAGTRANASNNSGGTASLGTGPIGTAIQGAGVTGTDNNVQAAGTAGASSPFGGAGGGGNGGGGGGGAAISNTGSGGGGGGIGATGSPAQGGAAGGFIVALISSPNATYSYSVGAGGTAGGAGASGITGGAGGSGYIEVTEIYQ